MSHQGRFLTALNLWGGMVAVTLSACSITAPWRDYSSQMGDYVVLIPGTPKQETLPVAMGNGKTLELQGVHVQAQQLEYAVAFVALPPEIQIPAGQSQRIMTGMVQGFAQRLTDGKITQDKELQVNGYPCREFRATGQAKSKAVKMAGRICLAGRRLYQALIKGEKRDTIFEENTNKFLTSFQITRKS